MVALSCDIEFMFCQGSQEPRQMCREIGSWKLGEKWWPRLSEVEMPELPLLTVEEGFERLRKLAW